MEPIRRELNSFIGRQSELNDLKQLLGVARLVTLTGPGGVGKTRLASRLEQDLQRAFAGRVAFVRLDRITEPADVAGVVSDALLSVLTDNATEGSVFDCIGDARILLVLDSCEHVMDACTPLIAELLIRCPSLRIVATSRTDLRIAGEYSYRVLPMSTDTDPETNAGQGDAVDLFIDRARAANSAFVLDDHELELAVSICNDLDGLPLAIELAAARTRVMTVAQLQERIQSPYRILSRGTRDAPPRQLSLWASMDWSFQLCTREEKKAWSRFAIFENEFDLHAATSIYLADEEEGQHTSDQVDVLDLLQALVEKCILVENTAGSNTTFRMLQTMRAYGRSSLDTDQAALNVRAAHANWVCATLRDLVTRSSLESLGSDSVESLLADVRLALEFYQTHSEWEGNATFLTVDAAEMLWFNTGRIEEGALLLTRAYGRDFLSASARGRIQALLCQFHYALGDWTIADELLATVGREEISADAHDASLPHHVNAWRALLRGDPQMAGSYLSEAVRIAESEHGTGDGFPQRERELAILAAIAESDFGRASSLTQHIFANDEVGTKIRNQCIRLLIKSATSWESGDAVSAMKQASDALRTYSDVSLGAFRDLAITVVALAADKVGESKRACAILGALRYHGPAGTQFDRANPFSSERVALEKRLSQLFGEERYSRLKTFGAQLTKQEIAVFADDCEAPTQRAVQSTSARTLLSPREQEVAALISEGLTNRDIASTLVVSVRTAEGHVEHILTKLGLTSRVQVAKWFFEKESRDDDSAVVA